MSKGFGRRQAYESLTCTTRGASGAGLWGFRISAVTHTGTIAGFRRSVRTMRTTICPDQAVWTVSARSILVMYGGTDDVRHERHRFLPRCLGRMHIGQAMPDHGANSGIRIGMFGGARGCRQRSKVSMMTMWPPQQGQGGRRSAGSSAAGSSGGTVTSSKVRARARLALRDELASRP